MAKFYKYNDQMDAQVGWRITDPDRIAWRKKGLQDTGRDLIHRKFFFYTFVIFFSVFILMMGIFLVKKDLGEIILFICVTTVTMFFFGTLFYLGILGGDVFTYRLTDTSFEEASWNDYIPLAKKLLQIPLWILSIALVFMVATKPEIILGVGLGGMVGVGLLAGATVYSSNYEKDNLNYQCFFTDWSLMAHRVEIDKQRRIVIFWGNNLNHKKHNIAMFSVFCTKYNFEQVSEFIINKAKEKQLDVHYKITVW
ncbi:hypothetical protein DKL61_08150 [Gammaproteobacteria bacterium ESL0073]|nr:hypothetical protein DKL61_08150 [Gammaproteobacteria bacterium ESL0073]